METFALFIITAGKGSIQVDFKNYFDWQEKAIYLSKGQYIKFLSDDFTVTKIDFPDEKIFESNDFRVLFKHLVSLGYINLNDCQRCREFLSGSVFSQNLSSILDISTDQWYWQNPFQANRDEYQLIFDLKEVIDEKYFDQLDQQKLSATLNSGTYNVQQLVKDKLGISIPKLITNKKALESQKDIAFTDKSIKEIAYEKGFRDPAYFNRFFRNKTGQTPAEFRKNFGFEQRETFAADILELLKVHHQQHHDLGFYADKMNMSVKTLSRQVRQKLNVSLGQLIRHEIISTAQVLLRNGVPVKEIAFELGFEEAHHFSTFFKHHTGKTPSSLQSV